MMGNDTGTTEIYTLSLHDALPIGGDRVESRCRRTYAGTDDSERFYVSPGDTGRSEEHTLNSSH